MSKFSCLHGHIKLAKWQIKNLLPKFYLLIIWVAVKQAVRTAAFCAAAKIIVALKGGEG